MRVILSQNILSSSKISCPIPLRQNTLSGFILSNQLNEYKVDLLLITVEPICQIKIKNAV